MSLSVRVLRCRGVSGSQIESVHSRLVFFRGFRVADGPPLWVHPVRRSRDDEVPDPTHCQWRTSRVAVGGPISRRRRLATTPAPVVCRGPRRQAPCATHPSRHEGPGPCTAGAEDDPQPSPSSRSPRALDLQVGGSSGNPVAVTNSTLSLVGSFCDPGTGARDRQRTVVCREVGNKDKDAFCDREDEGIVVFWWEWSRDSFSQG